MGLFYEKLITYQVLLDGWSKVKENNGCAGVDGITIKKFDSYIEKNLILLEEELQNKTYEPLPLLRFLVDKGNGEARLLSVPAVRDRVAQSAALKVLEPIFEAEFEDVSFAYRKGKSVKQAVCEVNKLYNEGYKWILDADIDGFFDNISHNLLLDRVGELIKDNSIIELIKNWIKAKVYDGSSVFQIKKGIPQGLVISPILANLFLDYLDEELIKRKYKMVRFADDFLILCKEKEQACQALEITENILKRMFLNLEKSKTFVTSFDKGFKFLGVIFLKSLAMVPYETKKKNKRILYMPPPFNFKEYLKNKDIYTYG